MAKKRRKRKSRMELYRARATKAYQFVTRIPALVRGGNPMGVSEATLMDARGPGLVWKTMFAGVD